MTLAPVGSSELLAELGEEFQQLANDLDTVDQNAATILVAFTQSVQTQAAIAKGRLIVEFRARNKEILDKSGGWERFLELKGISKASPHVWVRAYECYEENKAMYSDEVLYGFGASILAGLHTGVSSETKQRVLDSGSCTQKEVRVLTADPAEKLKKAEEDLAKAKDRLEKASTAHKEFDGGVRHIRNPKYEAVNSEKYTAKDQVKRYEAKIAKLKEQIQLEQDKTSAAEAAKDKAEEQLNQVMFDEKTSKGLQVKRVGYNLQNMVPQVLADSQRYISEKGSYPEDLRFHIDQQLIQLLTYLQSHYGN